MADSNHFYLCTVCSNSVPVGSGEDAVFKCDRCGEKHHRLKPKSATLSMVFALTALIFYIPANIFPFMTIDMYSNTNSATIWGGIMSLADSGSWPIALIVFLASMLIPFVKLVILFYLGLTAGNKKNSRFKTKLYHMVEAIGRWSMLDIYLMAVLVAVMKLGRWTNVVPEVGSILFALVVIFTMLSSAYFDPKLLWDNKNGKTN